MRRREAIIGGGTVAAAALAGCLSRAQESGDPSGSDPSDGSTRTVRVTGSGGAEADPDLAVLQIGVEATGDDAESVRTELATRSEEVREALLAAGVDEDDVTTSRFHVGERVDRRRMEQEGVDPRSREDVEEYTYFQGTHAFRVEVHDVDRAGDVVDAAIDAGADDVGRIVFTLSEERREELREEALTEAMDDARSEADHLAEQVDASVVEVRVIDASEGRVSPVREGVAMDAAGDGAATEFQPGDVTVSATVDVEYDIG